MKSGYMSECQCSKKDNYTESYLQLLLQVYLPQILQNCKSVIKFTEEVPSS